MVICLMVPVYHDSRLNGLVEANILKYKLIDVHQIVDLFSRKTTLKDGIGRLVNINLFFVY